MILNWLKMSTNFMSGLYPKWSSIIWLLIVNVVTLGVLSYIVDLTISETGHMTGTLKGDVPMTGDSLAIILSIPFVMMILISINVISEKNDLLYNYSTQSILKVLTINRAGFYLSGLIGKAIVLIVILLMNLFMFSSLFFLFFGWIISGLLPVFLGLTFILFSLVILFDFYFVITSSVNGANTFTTVILIVIFFINAMLRPIIRMGNGDAELLSAFKIVLLDLYLFVYLTIHYIVSSEVQYDQYYTLYMLIPMVLYICLKEHRKRVN